jgi:REP element-mobilizing transposase RayT
MRYKRHLPHWFPPGTAIFITWRLHGSIPTKVVEWIRETGQLPNGRPFKLLDEELDRARTGPQWLANPAIAKSVRDRVVRHGEILTHYRLHAYVIMSNHVHILITPTVSVPHLMNCLKTRTARRANELLGRTGLQFWHNESFDHWCRSDGEFRKIRTYIELNPVKAGLVARPEDWEWSSVRHPAAQAVTAQKPLQAIASTKRTSTKVEL